jgi:hypothetical protein
MALVVAGDFQDPDEIVELMRSHVEACTPRSPTPAIPIPQTGFSPHSAPRCTVFEDRETVQSQVHISFKKPRPGCSTPQEFHEYLKVSEHATLCTFLTPSISLMKALDTMLLPTLTELFSLS